MNTDKVPTLLRKPILAKLEYKTHRILAILVAIFVVVKILLLIFVPKPPALASDLTTDNILQAVNQQRSLRNLIVLNTDNRLTSAAQSKVDDMQARHYFAHIDPDGNYIWPKIVAAGYTPYLQLGENLAIEFYDTDSLISAWMNSPTHRANLLNDGFRDQGMGIAFGDVNAGQYHSAIANTFGTLLVKKAAAIQETSTPTAPSPTPTTAAPSQPKPKTQPKPVIQPAPVATPTPTPIPQTSSSTEPTVKAAAPTTTPATSTEPAIPVNTREENQLANNTPPQNTTTQPQSTPTTPPTPTPTPNLQLPEQAVINKQASGLANSMRINRYFSLSFGVVMFLFLMSDLQGSDPDNIKVNSKKINNLALLFIALVIIAVMYWL